MKRQLASLLILAVTALPSALPAQQTRPLPLVKVEGNKFIAEDRQVIFRGLDASDPDKLEKQGHWNQEYFDVISSWGANVVRFAVHPVAWRSRGVSEYLRLLDTGVAMATSKGLYVIIDWHSIGNLRSEMYQAPMYETTRKETYEFWRTIAKHYKGNTTIMGLELFNEPTVYNGQLGVCSWADWKAMNEEMITIIRANGNNAIPLVAGFNWAYDLTPIAKDPIQAEGIAYVSHPYPMKREKPWEGRWTADWGFAAAKYPLILTEIGFCGADEKGAHIPVISDESYGDAITNYCKEKGISYTIWCFDPDWPPSLISDWKFTPTRQGRYFKKALASK